jgi:hypothetical protein
MVGFGKKYPLRPHHRGSSCPTNITEVCNYNFAMTEERNPIIIWGAVVGGPDRHDGYKGERLCWNQGGEYSKMTELIILVRFIEFWNWKWNWIQIQMSDCNSVSLRLRSTLTLAFNQQPRAYCITWSLVAPRLVFRRRPVELADLIYTQSLDRPLGCEPCIFASRKRLTVKLWFQSLGEQNSQTLRLKVAGQGVSLGKSMTSIFRFSQ